MSRIDIKNEDPRAGARRNSEIHQPVIATEPLLDLREVAGSALRPVANTGVFAGCAAIPLFGARTGAIANAVQRKHLKPALDVLASRFKRSHDAPFGQSCAAGGSFPLPEVSGALSSK